MGSQVVAACKGKSTEELIAAGLPKLANMEKILSSVGVEADKERLSQVVAACSCWCCCSCSGRRGCAQEGGEEGGVRGGGRRHGLRTLRLVCSSLNLLVLST